MESDQPGHPTQSRYQSTCQLPPPAAQPAQPPSETNPTEAQRSKNKNKYLEDGGPTETQTYHRKQSPSTCYISKAPNRVPMILSKNFSLTELFGPTYPLYLAGRLLRQLKGSASSENGSKLLDQLSTLPDYLEFSSLTGIDADEIKESLLLRCKTQKWL
ncbi:hypothetical protein PGT21_031125 [Puccinia graminis f. sp. tritici]|uniref:Uncharacterized protein n=1 Tax=Puccinia graminis f. sp. tritici TaxID=56615 RepID=A0A5B0P9G6_PUCGR|nr:hypothetical protein PGT21_031125 [Puccinia graminis f. sp. tritici]